MNVGMVKVLLAVMAPNVEGIAPLEMAFAAVPPIVRALLMVLAYALPVMSWPMPDCPELLAVIRH
jgi:hypothetical protein